MSHLLPLSALHAAAPGVLDIVFGADGDFEGAPRWKGPAALIMAGIFIRWYEVEMIAWPEDGLMNDLALDCRIPSVAARLAGLCARAVPHVPESVTAAHVRHRRASNLWSLVWVDSAGFTKEASWNGDGTRTHPYDSDLAGAPFAGPAAFLASLTLALAPRIASLR